MKKNLPIVSITITGIGLLKRISVAAPVSEPTTMLILGTGLVGFAGIFKKRTIKKCKKKIIYQMRCPYSPHQ